jgi:two-component system alkaline phosphatase synthesis response regulator PhoP
MKTILIVDDEDSITGFLAMVLEDEGYQVALASNGRQALQRLAHERVSLLLTDVMMPGMDGPALVRAMQDDLRYASIPVIFMTAVPRSLDAASCRYEAVIGKPFSVDDLLAVVARLIGPP